MSRSLPLACFTVALLCIFSCHSDSAHHSALRKTPVQSDTIFIQPFYPVTGAFAQTAARELQDFYGIPMVILPAVRIYDTARSATGRYSADMLLKCLATVPRAKGCKILGLTTYDIYTAKNDIKEWGIFGLGDCPGPTCIVSDFRLRKFKGHTEAFTINVILHEIGHNYGLPHCDRDEKCLMNDAKGTIATLFKEQKWLCPHCTQLLASHRKRNVINTVTGWIRF